MGPVEPPRVPQSEDSANLVPSNANDTTMRHTTDNDEQEAPSSGSTIRNEDIDIINNHGDTNGTATSSQTITEPVSALTARPRHLIKTIQKISSLGIDATLPSLPKIVVVGDQSHGKSSVIEAMCGITLPRDAGTCTRCPFEIVTTATEDAWSCVVTIIHKYDLHPTGKKWMLAAEPTTTEFSIVREPEQLEHILRLAQVAVLHPNLRPSDVRMRNDVRVGPGIGFSPNVVHLKIAAPNLPELSLTDLPGAINVTENEDDFHQVSFVKSLITNYVKDQEAIILLTAAANADIELCNAFNIIRQQKASNRALGVITKPDLADAAITHRLGKIFGGETWALKHGWFATKQLSQEELDSGTVTRQKAKEIEKALFANPLWSGLNCPGRFGIENLQDALSQKLTAHILKALPVITERVESRLKEVDDELAQFPEQPQAPCLEVINEVGRVSDVLVAHIKGGQGHNAFRDAYMKVLLGLRNQFNDDAPELDVVTPGYEKPTFDLDCDDDVHDGQSSRHSSPVETPIRTKKRKTNDGGAMDTPTPQRVGQPLLTRTPKKARNSANDSSIGATFTLAQVRHAYESGNTSGLPDGLSLDVTDDLIHQCLENPLPLRVNDAVKKIETLLLNTLTTHISTTLLSRQGTLLLRETTNITQTFLRTLLATESAKISDHIAAELHKPIITDKPSLHHKKDTKRTTLLAARTKQRVDEFFDPRDARSGRLTSGEDRRRRADDTKWLADKLGPDPHEDILTAMLGPLAYYDVATRRVMDYLRLRMEFGVFFALREGVRRELMRGLRVGDEGFCKVLLAEDEGRERRRGVLRGERGRLVQARAELEGCRDFLKE